MEEAFLHIVVNRNGKRGKKKDILMKLIVYSSNKWQWTRGGPLKGFLFHISMQVSKE